MELFLNLVWVVTSSAALLAWTMWRRSSSSKDSPQMLRGLLVVVCVLALLFPVISISDDLSQTPSLAEGTRIQDVLKAPELRGIYQLSAILPAVVLALQPESRAVTRSVISETPIDLHEIFWAPSTDKRPPPQLS